MTATAGVGEGAAVSIWDVMDAVGFDPHAGQVEVMSSDARHRVLSGGRRLGKSQIGGHELVPEALITYTQRDWWIENGKRREFWIVGPEYSDSEKEFRVIWNCLKRLDIKLDKPGSYNNPISGDMHISCFDGAFQVHAKSAKYPETLVGEGLSGVILAEAAKLKESVWTTYIRPTLADFRGWSLHTSTPEGKNWFYRNWQKGQDPSRLSWKSWRMPSWKNNYVYPLGQADPEIAEFKADLTPESFKQEIEADFTEYVGRVFKEFDEEVHVRDLKFNPGWQTYAAVDYGFTNPAVWLLIQIGPWGEIHVVDEFYQAGLTVPQFVSEIKARGLVPPSLLRFYPDPASPGSSRTISDLIHVGSATGTGGELRERLDAIRAALKPKPEHLPAGHPEKIPTLLINRRCTNTIREFNDYRYPKSAEEAAQSRKELNPSEKPMKKDDHAPEALGRFFAGHFTATLARTGARVSEADFSN